MFDDMQNSDPTITRKVGEKLTNQGMRSPCRITVVTHKGNVTLSGLIQYEYQRQIAVKATNAIPGVHNVRDQMRLIPKSPPQKSYPGGKS